MPSVMNYTPRAAPAMESGSDAAELARYVQHELETIARSLTKFALLQLEVLHAEPEKPRDGMLAFADGTDWNPGSGAGTYERRSGAWAKL